MPVVRQLADLRAVHPHDEKVLLPLRRGERDPPAVARRIGAADRPGASRQRLRRAGDARVPGVEGDALDVTIRVTNSGTGHLLPTYITPKIFVNARILGAHGQPLAGTEQQYVIGRGHAID